MFGARITVVFGRRWRLAALGGVIAAVLVVGVVQAATGSTPVRPSRSATSSQHALAAVKRRLAVHASSTATATVNGQPATVSCGQTITVSTTLTASLSCPSSSGIFIGANSVVLNLGGNMIQGGSGSAGVSTTPGFGSDTIENGYVLGFADGVVVNTSSNTVTTMQTAGAASQGIFVGGSKNQVTSSTAEQNGVYGILDEGPNTIKADHLLNNGMYGLRELGAGALVVGNIANGNGIGQATDGMRLDGGFPVTTVTGNIANDNGAFGINAPSPSIDGGGNKAQGNTNQAQCLGIAC